MPISRASSTKRRWRSRSRACGSIHIQTRWDRWGLPKMDGRGANDHMERLISRKAVYQPKKAYKPDHSEVLCERFVIVVGSRRIISSLYCTIWCSALKFKRRVFNFCHQNGVILMSLKRACVSLALLAATGLQQASAQSPATSRSGTWTSGAAAPAPRSEIAIASLNDKAYVVGDYNDATTLLIYDLGRNVWSHGAAFPHPVHHAMALGYKGRVYVFGGYIMGWIATSESWAYDPKENAWTALAAMPTARAAGGVAVIEGKIHLVGGSGSGRINTSAHDVYDPAHNTWSSAARLPTPRDHLVVAWSGGKLVAAGGRSNGSPSTNLTINELYNPSTDTWSVGKALPQAVSGSASAVMGNEVYMFGGEGSAQVYKEANAYAADTDVWRSLPPLPTARHGFGAVFYDGKIYTLVGSPEPGGNRSNVVEIYTP